MPQDAIGQEVNIGDTVVMKKAGRFVLAIVTTILPNPMYHYSDCIDTMYITLQIRWEGQTRRADHPKLCRLKMSSPEFIKVPVQTYLEAQPTMFPSWASPLVAAHQLEAKAMYIRAFEFLLANQGKPKLKLPKDFR